MRILFLVFCIQLSTFAQKRDLEIYVSSIPENQELIELQVYQFKSDHFELLTQEKLEVIDTAQTFKISMPGDTTIRLLQIKLGDSPNSGEFIWSPVEEMVISGPLFSMLNGEFIIDNSKENLAYGRLLKTLSEYEEITEALTQESSSYSVYDHDFNAKVNSHAALVEEVHHKLNLNLEKIQIAYPKTYAADVLVPISKIPVRSYRKEWQAYYDGYLSFLHDYFFYFLNVEDERILNHYAFQDKLFEYLTEYVDNEQTATESAITALMEAFAVNPIVQSYVYNQLLRTYVQLDSEHFVNFLIENFGGGCSLELSFEDLKKMNHITAMNIGEVAPDILLYDLQNQARSLKNSLDNKEYTVVLFWVDWCEHCKKEMPDLISLATTYKKEVGFFAVSLSVDENKWKGATETYSFPKNWINVCEKVPIEKSTYAPLYHVTTTPSIFLLDAEGRIVAKHLKFEELKGILSGN